MNTWSWTAAARTAPWKCFRTLKSFHGRLKWISEPDNGIYDAMNKGVRMSSGDVVGFLNADDYYQDNGVLETIAGAFAQHGTDAVHGNLHYINAARKVVRTWRGTGDGSHEV